MGIELDLLETSDGELIVFHDTTTGRMTDADADVAGATLEQLKVLRLLGSEAEIPTLAEVLALVAGRTPLLLEIKPASRPGDVCGKVRDAISRYEGDLAVMSFDPRIVRWFGKHSPATLRVQLSGRFDDRDAPRSRLLRMLLRSMVLNAITRPSAIAYDIRGAPSVPLAVWSRLRRCPLLFWTVKSAADLARARELGGNVIAEGEAIDLLGLPPAAAATDDLR